jgi:lipoprotein-releasing system permease protein
MGATKSSIRRIFVYQGCIIGFCGTLFGMLGGLLVCWLLKEYKFIELPSDVYPMTSVPVDLQPWILGLVCVCAVVISLLATIYPSRFAGRLEPVEALRYE